MMVLKNPKKDKRKLAILEEAEPIVEPHSPIVEFTREEMDGTTDLPELNVEAEMASEPKPDNVEIFGCEGSNARAKTLSPKVKKDDYKKECQKETIGEKV